MVGIAALAIGYVLSQFYRSFMAVLSPALIADLGATKADLSLASGFWFVTFALMQFLVGIWLDRHGPRRTAALLLGLAGAGGAAIFAMASTPWMVMLGMGLIGIGCSPVLMATLFIFARRYPPAQFAMLASWFIAFGNAGNVVGASPLASAAEAFGWRAVMAGLAALTLLAALAIFAFVRDPEHGEQTPGRSGFGGFAELMTIRALWPIIPITAVGYAATAGIRGLWAGPFLLEVKGADTIAIGHVMLAMALAMVAGSFLYGPLDRLLGTRKWVGFGGNAVMLLAICGLALASDASIGMITVLLVTIGVTGTSYGLLMAHARAFFPLHLTGRGVTLMNFFSIGGVGVMQFVTGRVVTAAQAPGDPNAAYQTLWWFYAAVLGTALAIYMFSRDAKPE